MALQVSIASHCVSDISFMSCLSTGSSDFESFLPISVVNNADIHLFTLSDQLTLEYDDRVLLRFTPDHANLISDLESNYEYIRDAATVNIIDSNSKGVCV